MLIDWFTIGAQALNFLILVWLMKRFLYKPILDAIDAREKRIAAKLADADAKDAEAQKERDDFQQKNEALDRERALLLAKALDEAKAERQRLLDEARTEATALRAKHQEALRTERQNLNQDIIRWSQKEVFAITRKTLVDLAGVSLEERMGEVFVQRLCGMTGAAKEQLNSALKSTPQSAQLRSAFDLPIVQQQEIQKALQETFSTEINLQFETMPELVSGIELTVHGLKVAWSIADYLATLEKSAGELLQEDSKPDAEAGTKAIQNGKPQVSVDPQASTPRANHE